MNESIVLFLLLLAILIVSYGTTIINTSEAPGLENVSFSSTIKGCAQREHGMAPRTPLTEEIKPSIVVENNNIEYSRSLRHLCCRMVLLDRRIEGWTINIYENWSGLGCRCMCNSEISARIENLPEGTYTVNVYEKGLNTDGSLMQEKLITSEYVTIGF